MSAEQSAEYGLSGKQLQMAEQILRELLQREEGRATAQSASSASIGSLASDDGDDMESETDDSSPSSSAFTSQASIPSMDSLSSAARSQKKERPKGIKRPRANEVQRDILQRIYTEIPYPDREARHALAVRLGMKPKRIQIWFQNRRAKDHQEQAKRKKQEMLEKVRSTLNSATAVRSNPPAATSSSTPSQAPSGPPPVPFPFAPPPSQIPAIAAAPSSELVTVLSRTSSFPSAPPAPGSSPFIYKHGSMAQHTFSAAGVSSSPSTHSPSAKFSSSSSDLGLDAPIDTEGNGRLALAASEGRLALVKMMLDLGANPNMANVSGQTPLLLACIRGHLRIVEALLGKGQDSSAPRADPELRESQAGQSALHFAALCGNFEIMDTLLQLCPGVNVNIEDFHKRTPLHHACAGGHLSVARLLISHGANASATTKDMITPLHAAAVVGMKDLVSLLLASGCPINGADVRGWTPLSFAVKQGQADTVQQLIMHGASLECRTAEGFTPLHVACCRKDSLCLLILLQAGADIHARTSQGHTPVEVASMQTHTEQVHILLAWEQAAASA